MTDKEGVVCVCLRDWNKLVLIAEVTFYWFVFILTLLTQTKIRWFERDLNSHFWVLDHRSIHWANESTGIGGDLLNQTVVFSFTQLARQSKRLPNSSTVWCNLAADALVPSLFPRACPWVKSSSGILTQFADFYGNKNIGRETYSWLAPPSEQLNWNLPYIPGSPKTRKSNGASFQIEIHFSIQSFKFLCFQISHRLIIFFT